MKTRKPKVERLHIEAMKRTDLSHPLIMRMLKLFGYRSRPLGVCYGLGMMALQASLSGSRELQRFDRRLSLLPALFLLLMMEDSSIRKNWEEVLKNPLTCVDKKYFQRKKSGLQRGSLSI